MPPAVPPTPLVRFSHVRKSFGRGPAAVRDFSLDIGRGEFVTLLGPSGCGKTTLLMLLAGFERPDAGSIVLDGRTVSRTPPHRRDIGVVFQNAKLFPHLNVGENLAFPLRARGMAAAEQRGRVARALALMRLEGVAGRMPARLSDSELRRAALARAVVFEPRLMLLDDPFGALDPDARRELAVDIALARRQFDLTVVQATRVPDEALALSDRIAVLAGGVIRQAGTPRELYDEPGDAVVAQLMGETNTLAGTLESIEDDAGLVRLPGGVLVEGVLAEEMAVGARCVMSVRPERIAAAGGLADEAGMLAGALLDVVFRGDHALLRFSLGAGGPEIMVKRPAGAALGGLSPGRPAALAWQPHHGRIFLAET